MKKKYLINLMSFLAVIFLLTIMQSPVYAGSLTLDVNNDILLPEYREYIIQKVKELSKTESPAIVEAKRAAMTKRMLIDNLRTQMVQGAPAEAMRHSIEAIRAFKCGDLVGMGRALDSQIHTIPIHFFDENLPYILSEEFLYDRNEPTAFWQSSLEGSAFWGTSRRGP